LGSVSGHWATLASLPRPRGRSKGPSALSRVRPSYLPKNKIVINADLYSPPAAGGTLPNVSPNAVALFRNIARLKLDVSQHVPIHGNPGPQVDFNRIVAPVAARAPQQGGGDE
jgi:hypothetical protein